MRPKWVLISTSEERGPIPGRPQYVERRVAKMYRAAFHLGDQRISFECPCGEEIDLGITDGDASTCPKCGREFSFECAVVRIDAANIPPPGITL